MRENSAVGTFSSRTQSILFPSQMGVLAGLFLFLYGRILATLAQEWWTQEEASHGFLVLPICFIILWVNRRELRAIPIEPACKAGVLVMGTAGFLLILSEVGGVFTISQISMLIMLAGLALTLLGVRFLNALIFPLSYLLFMMPALAGAVLVWNWQFQLGTARMGVFFLQLLRVPARLDENHIILPNIILTVASSCSGSRYLISILALALPLGYLVLRRIKYRIALAVVALIIGITANWIRVVLIGLWAYSGGKVVHGPFHVLQALSVAWVAFAGLLFVAWALSRMESRGCIAGNGGCTNVAPEAEHRLSPHAWAQAVLVFLAVITYLSLYYRGPVPLKQSLATFPATIGPWVQLRENRELPMLRVVGAEEEMHRLYVGPGGQRLHLYVAYFESQQQGKEVVSYLMAPFHQDSQTLQFSTGHSGAEDAHRLALNKSENYEILFWYDINGRILANRLAAKASTIWDAITRGRTNGALVMIYCERDPSESQEPSSEQMKDFAHELFPVLRNYLP